MWRLSLPWSSRAGARFKNGRARRFRSYRPDCLFLEDRRVLSVSLAAGGPTTVLVGSPIVWTASAGGGMATPLYQFSVAPPGGGYQMVQDFSPSDRFTWGPLQQGGYRVQVIVKPSYSTAPGDLATATFTAASRVQGSSAVVSPTTNPLVALFSAPPSPGASMYVQFARSGPAPSWQNTASEPIVPGTSTNFLVAGMLPGSTYLMRYVLDNGTTSAPIAFATGNLPTNLTFPTFSVLRAATRQADPTQNIVFHIGVNPPSGTVNTVATDLAGGIVWYYDPVSHDFPSFATSVVPGGTVLLLGGQVNNVAGANTLREVDLAGDTLRETTVDAVNAELAAMGQPPIAMFTHDAQRLPNGDTAVLATNYEVLNHHGAPTAYQGNMVLVLDRNFQVKWAWNAFNWLSTSRLPTLGEGPGDWLHANAVAWSPEDGNLIVSFRAQDWVVKIDYANGTGDGHVVWRLGRGGDFRINASGASPWFSHQHDARYINATTIVVFDDGNVRFSRDPRAMSRGQEYVLDEKTMVATLVANVNLGKYAPALGSAQMLPNGNLVFGSGFAQQTIEVLPRGGKAYVQKMSMSGKEYRSYMYASMYGDPSAYSLPSTPLSPRLARRLRIMNHQAIVRQRRRARLMAARQHHLARVWEAHRIRLVRPGEVHQTHLARLGDDQRPRRV